MLPEPSLIKLSERDRDVGSGCHGYLTLSDNPDPCVSQPLAALSWGKALFSRDRLLVIKSTLLTPHPPLPEFSFPIEHRPP
ncbi:hypothetical protein CEXT_149761 [Caerostris extrusa]|uniref:Uncharacterized protein n=1 Tax=Caerostris extrusa TaxID=172846 RepID=A0AAV4QSV1_CAEEX|nr:hypothetical protein CEXT_149761 [Caerostris extrusa]